MPLEQYTLDYIRTELKVAARAGSNALYSIRQQKFNVIVTPQTQVQVLAALDKGRVDAILENAWVFESLIKKQGKSMLDYHAVIHQQKNMGVYFSHHFLKKHPEFLAKFNRNIAPCLQEVGD